MVSSQLCGGIVNDGVEDWEGAVRERDKGEVIMKRRKNAGGTPALPVSHVDPYGGYLVAKGYHVEGGDGWRILVPDAKGGASCSS
jgi:hypothetical protein